MKDDRMLSSKLDRFDDHVGGVMADELRKMQQGRATLMTSLAEGALLEQKMRMFSKDASFATEAAKQARGLESASLVEELRRLSLESPAAVQLVNQWNEARKAEQERIKTLLGPLQDIRNQFVADSALQRMLDDFAKAPSAADLFTRHIEQATGSSAFLKSMHSSLEDSMASARKLLSDASISDGLDRLMKGFELADRRWVVPRPLLDTLGPLRALQEQLGRLALPVMDVASAATLAGLLGSEGIQEQLAAMGIGPEGPIADGVIQPEAGIGLSRKSLELMALLGFILAILVPIYQEISSAQWQKATDKALTDQARGLQVQGDALEGQRKMIEALTKLVEKAIAKEAFRNEERFVVLDRVAEVRAKPEHGSTVEGKLLPREVVRPLAEHGKWIEFEYYHWLRKEHRTGWALKKYFQRVPSNFAGDTFS